MDKKETSIITRFGDFFRSLPLQLATISIYTRLPWLILLVTILTGTYLLYDRFWREMQKETPLPMEIILDNPKLDSAKWQAIDQARHNRVNQASHDYSRADEIFFAKGQPRL